MDRVLIVDDEPGIRGLMCRWAESLGWSATGMATAGEALEALLHGRYDVVVAAAGEPAPDGLWLAARSAERQLETAVVLTAENGAVQLALDALRLGVGDYLVKPFEKERFRDAIAGARDHHRAAVERERRRRSVAAELGARRAQLVEAFAGLRLADEASVRGAVALLAVRDRATFDHSLRVADLGLRLARDLGIGGDVCTDLRLAALLHEVPRAAVPETVLWRTGSLNAAEWALLRSQPDFAWELFRHQPLLRGAARILRAVREHHDGSGYPAGLAGEAIPIGARVLAAADAFDTMTHSQTHRDPLSPSMVREEIAAGRGTQFDPRVADALMRIGAEPTLRSHT